MKTKVVHLELTRVAGETNAQIEVRWTQAMRDTRKWAKQKFGQPVVVKKSKRSEGYADCKFTATP